MSQLLRVEHKYACVDRWHLRDGAAVGPGMRLVDVIGPDGTTQTLKANTWGVFIINDQLAKASFDDTDAATLPVDNDNLQCVSRKPTARLADSWAIAAYTSGFTTFYKGDDEISVERRAKKTPISYGDPDCNANRVYGEGDCLCQVFARKMRGSVKTAVPHPTASKAVSRRLGNSPQN